MLGEHTQIRDADLSDSRVRMDVKAIQDQVSTRYLDLGHRKIAPIGVAIRTVTTWSAVPSCTNSNETSSRFHVIYIRQWQGNFNRELCRIDGASARQKSGILPRTPNLAVNQANRLQIWLFISSNRHFYLLI